MRNRLIKALSWAVFPALLVGGFALAAQGDDSGQGSGNGPELDQTFELPAPPPGAFTARFHGKPPKGAPRGGVVAFAGPGPLADGELTYSETHVMRDGEAVVLRDDRGEVASVSSDSITVSENDGSDVTIPVDSDTKVGIPPDKPGEAPADSTVADLQEGQQVMVHREDGQAADFIGVIPDNLDHPFMPLPPPPGAPSGGDEDAN